MSLEREFNKKAFGAKDAAPDKRQLDIAVAMENKMLTASDQEILYSHVLEATSKTNFKDDFVVSIRYGGVKTRKEKGKTFHAPVYFDEEKIKVAWFFFIWPEIMRQSWVEACFENRKHELANNASDKKPN